ncbi:Dfp1/Him1, central region-domain-containing protein [Mycena floridula]|nr:Dfp1/Him1, central region-domain-containing protein [Mycena floridula]
MAATSRNPLSSRLLPKSNLKRPHSSEGLNNNAASKRSCLTAGTSALVPDFRDKKKETKKEAKKEREKREAIWLDKFTRHFPSFRFYFDKDNINVDVDVPQLENRIYMLYGKIETFFSSDRVNHLISDKPLPKEPEEIGIVNKENVGASTSKSKGRRTASHFDEPMLNGDVVEKAQRLKMKIWTTAKLITVLDRLQDISAADSTAAAPQLKRLLHLESIHGTSERDPAQKRKDFHYFLEGSFFVLVEDLQQEMATIIAHQYENPKDPGKSPWPILHLDYRRVGLFVKFDEVHHEKEKLKAGEQQRKQIEEAARRKAGTEGVVRKTGDLRRSLSLSNLHRQAKIEIVDLDCEFDGPESAKASGYLASGPREYFAASGNSVGITSGTGTTSTSTAASAFKVPQVPTVLRNRKEVIMARKLPSTTAKAAANGDMGPPAVVPEKQIGLRRRRSTNTMKLPPRDETSKPGYCESCHQLFQDFKEVCDWSSKVQSFANLLFQHIRSKKHRKFATDDSKFWQLDRLLDSIKRRTVQDVQAEPIRRVSVANEESNMNY